MQLNFPHDVSVVMSIYRFFCFVFHVHFVLILSMVLIFQINEWLSFLLNFIIKAQMCTSESIVLFLDSNVFLTTVGACYSQENDTKVQNTQDIWVKLHTPLKTVLETSRVPYNHPFPVPWSHYELCVFIQVCGDADRSGVLSGCSSGVSRVWRRRGKPRSSRRLQGLGQM